MRISKISLVLAFCLPVFLFSCRKDNGVGKYIVKVTAIGEGTFIQGISYKGKKFGSDSPEKEPSTWTSKDTIEADGHLKIFAFVAKDKGNRIGVKMEVFKLGSGGKKTKVASVSKSAAKGFHQSGSEMGFYYGATIEFPGNKKGAIETNEQLEALSKEVRGE